MLSTYLTFFFRFRNIQYLSYKSDILKQQAIRWPQNQFLYVRKLTTEVQRPTSDFLPSYERIASQHDPFVDVRGKLSFTL